MVLAMFFYNKSIKYSLDIDKKNIIFTDYFYRLLNGKKQKIYQM